MNVRPTPLKLAIVHDGRSQREIATHADVHEATLSRIVNGLHCDDATRSAIAEALGRTVDELWPPTASQPAA